MTIRMIKKKDIEDAVALVHALNLNPEFHSGYCPRDKALVEKEIEAVVAACRGMVCEANGELNGVLLYFKTPKGAYDLSGPFVKGGDVQVADALMNGFLETVSENVQVNAFFDAASVFYRTLMTKHGFEFRENEYILELSKDRFAPCGKTMTLARPHRSDKPFLKTMLREIFGETYISEDMLVDETRFKHILMPVKEGQVLGLALLIPRRNDAYLEIFGLLEAHRGKGYAKPFLHALAIRAFTDMKRDQVTLVVDAVNERALNLYKDAGFEVARKNVSYERL